MSVDVPEQALRKVPLQSSVCPKTQIKVRKENPSFYCALKKMRKSANASYNNDRIPCGGRSMHHLYSLEKKLLIFRFTSDQNLVSTVPQHSSVYFHTILSRVTNMHYPNLNSPEKDLIKSFTSSRCVFFQVALANESNVSNTLQ